MYIDVVVSWTCSLKITTTVITMTADSLVAMVHGPTQVLSEAAK